MSSPADSRKFLLPAKTKPFSRNISTFCFSTCWFDKQDTTCAVVSFTGAGGWIFFYDRRCWPRIYCADVRVELIFPYNPQKECKSTYFLKKNQNIPASGGKYLDARQKCGQLLAKASLTRNSSLAREEVCKNVGRSFFLFRRRARSCFLSSAKVPVMDFIFSKI